MSPWPRDRILAWICPRAVVIALQKLRLGRTAIVAHLERLLAQPWAGRDGSSCVAELESLLEQSGWSAGALSVCISDHFVRYAMLPWRPGLKAYTDWDAYAHHEIEARYGAKRSCELRVAPAPARASRFVAAVDAELLQRLRDMAARRGLGVAAMEPNACRVANRFRRQLGRRAHLLVAEADRVTWLSVMDDRWTDVASVRNEGSKGLGALAMSARLHGGYDPDTDEVWAWGPLDEESVARTQLASVMRLEAPSATPQPCSTLGLL